MGLGLRIWLRVWVLGFWDLAYGLSLKVLGICLVFWIKGFGIFLGVLGSGICDSAKGLELRRVRGLGFWDLA